MTISFSLFICAVSETEIHTAIERYFGGISGKANLFKQDPLKKAFKCRRRSPTGNIDPIYVNVYFITILILQIR